MPRATLERRPTLDELFGPEAEAEMEAVRREVDAAIEAETEAVRREVDIAIEILQSGPLTVAGLEAYRDAMSRYNELERLKVQRQEFSRKGLGLTFFLQHLAEVVEGADGEPEVVVCDKGRDPTIKVYFYPSLGQWLLRIRPSFRDSIRRGQEDVRKALDSLRKMLERFAAIARIAVDRCLSAIDEALAMLRRRAPVVAPTASSALTPRELIGELLSPHVLAAGGGFGLFVTRC